MWNTFMNMDDMMMVLVLMVKGLLSTQEMSHFAAQTNMVNMPMMRITMMMKIKLLLLRMV